MYSLYVIGVCISYMTQLFCASFMYELNVLVVCSRIMYSFYELVVCTSF